MKKRILSFFVVTLNGMALGLFSTLIIGVIIGQIATLSGIDAIQDLSNALIGLMGVGIGLGVAWSVKLTGLPLIAGAMAGGIATALAGNDPVVAYITSVAAVSVLRLVFVKKTPLDIVLIPLVSGFIALIVTLLIAPPVEEVMTWIEDGIQSATAYRPLLMGAVIAVTMGIALTSPISSAAIAVSIQLSGIAGGAAVVGGAVQMLGFAVMSRKDNSIGTVLSIGFGTSMIQFKNVLKKPIIWLPPIIASLVLGPLSTVLFTLETHYSGAGMGTSALIGQIATLDAMGNTFDVLWRIGLLHFVLPIAFVWVLDGIFRKRGWIGAGDLRLAEV